jgi:hypothetical protein
MKKLNYLSKFRNNNKLSAFIALVIMLVVVLGCGGGKPEMPKDDAVQSLVKATLSDFADAVDKGDFSGFRAKSSQDFQSQFSDEQMKTAFKAFIDAKAQTVPVLRSAAGMNANFSAAPSIREEKGNYILVTAGTMNTTPAKTRFNFEYVWRDGAWKLLVVKTFLE